jgi:hypothetical protein
MPFPSLPDFGSSNTRLCRQWGALLTVDDITFANLSLLVSLKGSFAPQFADCVALELSERADRLF